jgi:hypothetical protein
MMRASIVAIVLAGALVCAPGLPVLGTSAFAQSSAAYIPIA